MIKAIWHGKIIAKAEESKVKEIEGNIYFPPESTNQKYLIESDAKSVCPWKGEAHYYTLKVENNLNENAGWYYPNPSDAAKEIKNYVAFWRGVEIKHERS